MKSFLRHFDVITNEILSFYEILLIKSRGKNGQKTDN